MLWQQMKSFLESFFVFHNLGADLLLLSTGLAVFFGVLWFIGYWPILIKNKWYWAVIISSAFLTLLAVTFVQIPLQYYTGQALTHFWSQATLVKWLLLAGIPQILLSGLVQEGSKMVPVGVWWWRTGKNLTPKIGLMIGAAAGAGFGIFEAFWAHATAFQYGWTVQLFQTHGFWAISPFWERFFAVAFHIAVSGLVGYGLAKGKGWQFYLVGSVLHGLLNYGVVILQKGILTPVGLEIYVAVGAIILSAIVYWLRWQKTEEIPPGPVAPIELAVPQNPLPPELVS